MTKTTNVKLDDTCVIQELALEGTYKYLGIDEDNGIKHAATKEKVRKEYYHRIKMILKSELNSCNKITAINALALPVVSYSLNVINWQMFCDMKCCCVVTYRSSSLIVELESYLTCREHGARDRRC